MTDLNIHPSLTFSAPVLLADGDVNFVKFTPLGSNVFNQNDNITIKLASNNELLVLDRSYLKFNIQLDTAGTLSPQGVSAIFSSISDTVSGMQLPIQRNANITAKVALSTDSNERKALTGVCELYTQGSATGQANTIAQVFTVTMPVPTSLSSSEKYIPLCFMNAGHQVSYQLAPASQVCSLGSYQITNVELVACMVQPPNSYLEEVARGLAAGNSLKLPLNLTKSITVQPSAGITSQVINLQVGYLGSINSITLVEKNAGAPMINQDGISSFFTTVDGARFPRNKSVASTSESLYQILAGYSTKLSSISLPDIYSRFKQYTWKSNGMFSSGVPSANGTIEISLEFSSVPSTLECIINYDAMLLISANSSLLVTDI